ncbi:MAG TPA: response regulator, partial [Ktedonobacteraceae bacterium]|nr:response regulator [Ktedonobacteraceae bacterium]
DDDPIIRDMMVDIFSFEEYPIVVARNGREALEKLRGKESYLVFLDLMMPIMDGREFCQHFSADPSLRNRHKIVIMSAMDKMSEAASLPTHGTLPKPFSVDDVMRVMQPLMG